jgi:hypothetical protein
MNTDQFEMLLDNHIRAKGIEKVILRTIFPFLEKVGILWVTNHVNPAQEHLATNIIRQKFDHGYRGFAMFRKPSIRFCYFYLRENTMK